jgi:transcriptional regulator with XRE-family HTH domain
MANEKLKAARYQRRWSQAVAAERAGVAVLTYSRWEKGTQRPYLTTLDQLCNAFGMPPEELGFEPAEVSTQVEIVSATNSSMPLALTDEQITESKLQEPQIIRLTSEQLAVLRIILEDNGMAHFDLSRRETLRQIAIAIGAVTTGTQTLIDPEPWRRLSDAQTKESALNGTSLDIFEDLVGESWKLTNLNKLDVAQGIIASFLPKIQAIPPSEVNARLAFIASQGLRLQSILMHHHLHIADKMLICKKSVEYARYANDANTLVTALIELATAYEFSGQLEKCFQTLQEALFYCPQASPLIQSRVYSNNAILLASSKRRKEAELYIGLAHDTFPDAPELDPAYLLADSSIFMLSHHTGMVCLNNGQLTLASEGFESYKDHSSGISIPERLRLEIVNGLSKTAIQAGDLERYTLLFEDAIAGATRLGSKKRFGEAISIFQQEVPQIWRTNGHIKDLAEKYRLDSKVECISKE